MGKTFSELIFLMTGYVFGFSNTDLHFKKLECSNHTVGKNVSVYSVFFSSAYTENYLTKLYTQAIFFPEV